MFSLRALPVVAFLAAGGALSAEARTCFSPEQTRIQVSAHKLVEPFKLMKKAASTEKADPISGKLCQWNEKLVYEISLLRKDGQVLRVFLDAATGQQMGPHSER